MPALVTRILGGAALVAAAAAGAAEPAPVVIAGGALDSRFTGGEVYAGRPTRGKVPAGKACAAANSYIDHINGGKYREVHMLFAEDGVLFEPSRQTYRGRDAIRTFYEGRIGPLRPEVVPVIFVGTDRECMIQIAALTDFKGEKRFRLAVAEHFRVDDRGKITFMIAFPRPQAQQ